MVPLNLWLAGVVSGGLLIYTYVC